MSDPRPLHRLFGLSWSDFFQGSDIAVEPETDLSQKQQFVDLAIVRRGPGPIPSAADWLREPGAAQPADARSHQER
jgi:hypothetical protein